MSIAPTTLPDQKTIGMVSLGCPKALVDSERILTRLRADGYAFAEDYAGADVVLGRRVFGGVMPPLRRFANA
jgi:ribosomal protein S12 methylthiotransferase